MNNTSLSNIASIKKYIIAHKAISTIVALVLVYVGYSYVKSKNSTSTATQYILATVTKGSIVSSVTGTGQVSASNQVNLNSKVSGNIVALPVVVGQEVHVGDLIAQVDAQSAALNLESAKIAYQKLTKPATEAQISQAKTTVAKAYDDSWNTISSVFQSFPEIIAGMNTMINQNSGYLNVNQTFYLNQDLRGYRDKAGVSFDKTRLEYEAVLAQYNKTTRLDSTASIRDLVEKTYVLVKDMSNTLKDAQNAVTYISSYLSGQNSSYNLAPAQSANSSLTTWLNQVNGDLSTILSNKNSIVSGEDNLNTLVTGADSLDIASQQLDLQAKEDAYNDSFIRAPFDGVVAKLNIKKTDTVSSGTTVGVLITKQSIANVSLNEVDVASVKVGQPATLTFDAIDGLSIAGQVSGVDLIGTVTQGVVTYNVEIAFDTQDPRVKSGMSVSASIVTNVKQDILTVPNGAIQSQGNSKFVLIPSGPTVKSTAGQGVTMAASPTQQEVEVGVSNDTTTEIVSGLGEGDSVIARTITATAAKTTTAPSLLGSGSRTGGGTRISTP
jgi:HlyD family secretion protein